MSNSKFSSIKVHIGQQLKSRRKELKLNQRELAHMLGITPQQLSKYERRPDAIPAHRLFKLCKVLSVTPNYFFDGLEDICFSFTEHGFWLSGENMVGQKVQIELADFQATIIDVKVFKESR